MGGKRRHPPGVQNASVLLLFFAVSKRSELHREIVKSAKNVKIATPFTWVTVPDSCFTVFAGGKSLQKATIYVEPAFGKTQNVAFYSERAPG